MLGTDELKKMIRRNMLLGLWAAEKLGLAGEHADTYAKALAVGTLDADSRDVFSKIRRDFDTAGIICSDAEILRVMNELALQTSGGAEASGSRTTDAAAVQIARNLSRGS